MQLSGASESDLVLMGKSVHSKERWSSLKKVKEINNLAIQTRKTQAVRQLSSVVDSTPGEHTAWSLPRLEFSHSRPAPAEVQQNARPAF